MGEEVIQLRPSTQITAEKGQDIKKLLGRHTMWDLNNIYF